MGIAQQPLLNRHGNNTFHSKETRDFKTQKTLRLLFKTPSGTPVFLRPIIKNHTSD
jgi:hypothetical protein